MSRKSETSLFHEAHLASFARNPFGGASGTFTVAKKAYAALPEGAAHEERVCEVDVKASVTVRYFDRIAIVATVDDGDEDETIYGVADDGRVRRRSPAGNDPLGGQIARAMRELDHALLDQETIASILGSSMTVDPKPALSAWASDFVASRTGDVAYVVSGGTCSEWVKCEAPFYELSLSGDIVGQAHASWAWLVAAKDREAPREWTKAALAFGADEESVALALAENILASAEERAPIAVNDRINLANDHPFPLGHAFRQRAALSLLSAVESSAYMSAGLRRVASKAAGKSPNRALDDWPSFVEAWDGEGGQGRIKHFLEAADWTLKIDPVRLLSVRFGIEQVPDSAPALQA